MKLDRNFTLNRYRLQVRLVNDEDAEFIVKLRSDSKLAKYLSVTQNDVEIQKQWIREYKIREEQGLDYYFIYFYEGKRIGLNRIYNINGKTATSGSWICAPDLLIELPISTLIIMREIFFEILLLDIDYMDTRKNNKKVIKMHNLQGAHKIFENEIDVFHYITTNDFKTSKPKFLQYFNLTEDQPL
jgi:hypothetical protein